MSTEENPDLPEVAAAFARSLRGQYIIGQALSVAIKTMKKVPHPHTEVSNIEDMEFLLEHLYPIGRVFSLTMEDGQLVHPHDCERRNPIAGEL